MRRRALTAAAAASLVACLAACGSVMPGGTAEEGQSCVSWVSFDDDDARSDASEIVVEAVVQGRAGERAMFGAQASVWDVEVTAVRKGDVAAGDHLEVASTPVTCSGATYPDGDPLDTADPLVLFLDDSDFGIAGTEPGLALITPLDGAFPLAPSGGG